MRDVFKLFESWRRYKRSDHYSVGADPFYGPPPMINDVIDCWATEGIRFFTETHNANGMLYQVMLPTDELEFHVERDFPSHHDEFIAQGLIQDGRPSHAVRIQVGKNGRAVIDRDADIVMAAKRVGLPRLPVIFNFVEEV